MSRCLISPDNPVRRRLFPLDAVEQADIDNFANVLQEEAARTKIEKMQKWNFDFENELPLEGRYEWIRCDEPAERTEEEEEMEVNESQAMLGSTSLNKEEGMQRKNETTPGKQLKEEALLLNEKRKEKTASVFDKVVRRNIYFE